MAASRSHEQQKMARFAEHPPYHLRFEVRGKAYLLTSEFVQPSWSLLRGVDAIAAVGVIAAATNEPGFDRQLRSAFPVELGHLAIPYAAAPVVADMIARRRMTLFDLGKPQPIPSRRVRDMTLSETRPADLSFHDKLVRVIDGIATVPPGEIETAARAEFLELVTALAAGGGTRLAIKLAGVIASWVALHFVPGAGTAAALLIDAGMISFLVYSLGFAAL